MVADHQSSLADPQHNWKNRRPLAAERIEGTTRLSPFRSGFGREGQQQQQQRAAASGTHPKRARLRLKRGGASFRVRAILCPIAHSSLSPGRVVQDGSTRGGRSSPLFSCRRPCKRPPPTSGLTGSIPLLSSTGLPLFCGRGAGDASTSSQPAPAAACISRPSPRRGVNRFRARSKHSSF